MLTTAVAQFAATTDKADNLRAVGALIAEAAGAGARLVVLPEYSMYSNPDSSVDLAPHAEPVDGPFVTSVALDARRLNITVIVGTCESNPHDPARPFNTVIAVAPSGDIAATYRKVHLYDAFGYRESDQIRPGPIDAPRLVDVEGVRVGIMTCYDLRFPEMARYLVDAGAEAIALPAAWAAGPLKEEHWTTLIRARAIENTVYLIASGQSGPQCTALSQIVDPMGITICCAGEAPGIAIAPLRPERVSDVRQKNPSLANRRFSVTPR